MATDTTDIVTVDHQVRFLPTKSETGRVWGLAQQIANTDFVPKDLRGNPPAILAAMLTGREIGIGAMHALRAIDVIDGRPALSAELMMSLALRAGHDVDVAHADRTSATVRVRRIDWPQDRWREVTFDEVDARLAGLVGPNCAPAEGKHDEKEVTKSGRNGTYTKVECGCKQGYKTYPRAMYRSRAITEAVRTHLADVVERVSYTVEELGGDPPDHDEALQTVQDVTPDQADAVAQATADDDSADVVDAEVVDESEVTAVGAPTLDDAEPDEPEEPAADTTGEDDTDPQAWRQIARDHGVTPTHVLAQLVRTWPSNNQSARPNRLADVDDLFVSTDDGPDLVGDAIRAAADAKEAA